MCYTQKEKHEQKFRWEKDSKHTHWLNSNES